MNGLEKCCFRTGELAQKRKKMRKKENLPASHFPAASRCDSDDEFICFFFWEGVKGLDMLLNREILQIVILLCDNSMKQSKMFH